MMAVNLWVSDGDAQAYFSVALNVSIAVIVLAYLLIYPAFLRLRHRAPDLDRPFRIPGGNVVAWVLTLLATGWSLLVAVCLLWPGFGTVASRRPPAQRLRGAAPGVRGADAGAVAARRAGRRVVRRDAPRRCPHSRPFAGPAGTRRWWGPLRRCLGHPERVWTRSGRPCLARAHDRSTGRPAGDGSRRGPALQGVPVGAGAGGPARSPDLGAVLRVPRAGREAAEGRLPGPAERDLLPVRRRPGGHSRGWCCVAC